MSSDTEADEEFEWQESVGEPDDGTGDGADEAAAASASTGTPASAPASASVSLLIACSPVENSTDRHCTPSVRLLD